MGVKEVSESARRMTAAECRILLSHKSRDWCQCEKSKCIWNSLKKYAYKKQMNLALKENVPIKKLSRLYVFIWHVKGCIEVFEKVQIIQTVCNNHAFVIELKNVQL